MKQKIKQHQHFKEVWRVLCQGLLLSDRVQYIVKVMIQLVNPVMIMNGMINSDEIYNSRNEIIYHCDKSAINKYVNRIAINV